MGKKILMLAGEFSEEYEIFVFEQAMTAVGHVVHVVCPGKKAGEQIKTSLHDFEGGQTYTEKPGHLQTLNATFARVEPEILRRGLCRGRTRARIHPHRQGRAENHQALSRFRQTHIHDLPWRAGADGGQRRSHRQTCRRIGILRARDHCRRRHLCRRRPDRGLCRTAISCRPRAGRVSLRSCANVSPCSAPRSPIRDGLPHPSGLGAA